MKRFISLCLITLTGYVLYGAAVLFFVAGRLASRLVGGVAAHQQCAVVTWYQRKMLAFFREKS